MVSGQIQGGQRKAADAFQGRAGGWNVSASLFLPLHLPGRVSGFASSRENILAEVRASCEDPMKEDKLEPTLGMEREGH